MRLSLAYRFGCASRSSRSGAWRGGWVGDGRVCHLTARGSSSPDDLQGFVDCGWRGILYWSQWLGWGVFRVLPVYAPI